MADIRRPVLTKIPGITIADTKNEHRLKDLTKLTDLQIRDLAYRQQKLLEDVNTIKYLKDKGEGIHKLIERIEAEMKRRSNIEEAVTLFSKMNIAEHGLKTMNALEWKADGVNEENLSHINGSDEVIDSDDDEEFDPLRIIARAQMHKRQVKVLKPEPTLITNEDLCQIKELQENSSNADETINSEITDIKTEKVEQIADAELVFVNVSDKLLKIKTLLEKNNNEIKHSDNSKTEIDQHVKYLVDKTELTAQPKRETFKPFKTTKQRHNRIYTEF